MRALAPALAVTLTLVLAGCSNEEPDAGPPSAPPSSATPAPSETPASPSESAPGSPSETPSQPSGLDWRPVPGPVADSVTVSGRWRLTATEDGRRVLLDGPRPDTFEAPRGYAFTEALLDGRYAVVVAEHEQATRPNVATVVELASGETGEADVPPGVGGSWALGSGLLATTVSRGRDYCLAVADLVAGSAGRAGPCVPPRHGISNLTIGPAGTSAMTFDDSRPSCRTLNRVEGERFVPLAGVGECRGWEAVMTETFAAWTEVPDERRIEEAELFLDAGAGVVELGPVTTGSLTWCGSSAYVVRDPQRSSDPARLLRVDVEAGTTEVVYETRATGRAFLSEPRCGGSDLTITAYSDEGDEQVTARVS